MSTFDVAIIAVIGPAVVAAVQLAMNFLTFAWPARPSWAALGAALLAGVVSAFGYALAFRIPIDTAIAAQLVITGVTGAAGAGLLNVQSVKADATRDAAIPGRDRRGRFVKGDR